MARPNRRLGNLPAEATSFIGRRRELAELRRLMQLSTTRLVSLVGPGGVGKTRLAIRITTDLARGFRDGAWLVELAELQDAALLSDAVLAALDLRDQAATDPLAPLLAYLSDKQLLLVVDNCEHVLAVAARVVANVISAAPGVRVIATSREPLSISGEHVLPVPPLELPSGHPAELLARLRQNEAVMLFAERAAAASGTFELTPSNQAAVVDICRRLDGLPLAIELAAVRTRVLSAEQIRDRLTDRFALLTAGSRAALPRHQTLRTTIEWSHDLLTPRERTLLRRLGVFAGRYTLEDVESVCTVELVPLERALDVLASLLDKSLVMKEDADGVAAYRLHETMREYTRLKLREAGEQELIERRCAEYYQWRCRRSAKEARYRLLEWFAWMELEIDNIRSVLQRCLIRDDFAGGIDLANSLGWYWITRATAEGVRWLDALLAPGFTSTPDAVARAYFLRGFLAVLQVDPPTARKALAQAIAAARESGQQRVESESLSMASIAENMADDRASAERLLDAAQATTTGLDDVPARLTFLQASALNGLFEGDADAARSASTEGARLSREVGDLYTLQHMLINRGLADLIAGAVDKSKPAFADALRIARQIDDRVAQFYLLGGLGCCASAAGEWRLSAQLLGAAESLRVEVGASMNAMLAQFLPRAQAWAMSTLGPSRFNAEFEAGRRLRREAAVRLALAEPAEDAGAASAHAGAGLLGKREAEVAALVTQGLSNKQIGARLFISEHTVDTHIRNILNKLGVNSRAQVAGWVQSSHE